MVPWSIRRLTDLPPNAELLEMQQHTMDWSNSSGPPARCSDGVGVWSKQGHSAAAACTNGWPASGLLIVFGRIEPSTIDAELDQIGGRK